MDSNNDLSENFDDQSVEMTKWVCPGRYFYIGCAIVGCGIIYSKSWPAEKLVLNFCSALGYAFLSFWGHTILQHFDVAMWFAILTIANVGILCYRLHDSFDALKAPSVNTMPLYEMLFAPMNVDFKTFKELMACSNGLQTIEANDLFAAEGQRNAGAELSVLLSGKLVATQNEQTLHSIMPGQFMDSPEWEAYDPETKRTFRVTIIAEVDSTYVTWRRSNMEKLMKKNKYLTHMMNLIIGRDIAYKLYNTHSSIWSPLSSQNSSRNNNNNNNNTNNTSNNNNNNNSSHNNNNINSSVAITSTSYSNGGLRSSPVICGSSFLAEESLDETMFTFASSDHKQSEV
ncbi:popeye domain-containing protein 3-like isoform X2 [Symsagittifera roscoffensis]|uniref:popeye domain-containing protein 3-like isoform X2 n=1 Tax=Symsagittifera roscoffensis TaxID=84072 RepID=UPI00307C9353